NAALDFLWPEERSWRESVSRQLPHLKTWGDKPVPKLAAVSAEWFEHTSPIDIDPVPNAVLGVALLSVASLLLVITTRHWWRSRRCWVPVLESTGVVPLWVGCWVLGAAMSRVDPPVMGPGISQSVLLNANLDQVHEQLRDALWRYHYQTDWDIGQKFFNDTT